MVEEETIELPDADAPVEISVADEKEPAKSEEKVDEREVALSEMRAQLEAAKKQASDAQHMRAQAEAYAKKQAELATSAKSEATENQYRVILNAINAHEQTAANAERALADALASGDYATVAKVQSQIAKIQSQLTQFEQAKGELEEMAQYRQAEGRVPEPAPTYQPPVDPIEAVASRLSPKSAQWIRTHPEMVNKIPQLKAAHESAVHLKGITAESPEYFAYIENELGISAKTPKKPAASTPVTSAASYSASRGGNDTMTLSSAEVEQALLNEPDLPRQKALEMYARNKQALIREGRL